MINKNENDIFIDDEFQSSNYLHINVEESYHKLDHINLKNNYHCNSDVYILETILEQFIPFFSRINTCNFNDINSESSLKFFELIHDLIKFTTNREKLSPLKTKIYKNIFQKDKEENFALEAKEFLYKTYISSSDTKNDTFKFSNEDTLKLNKLSKETIRGLLILIKEEIEITLNNNFTFQNKNFNNTTTGNLRIHNQKIFPNSKNFLKFKNNENHHFQNNQIFPNSSFQKGAQKFPATTLLQKLFYVKKIIISESKMFDFKLLFILLNFILLNFCLNLEEIEFQGTLFSKLDQIDVMLKNGVFLYFIYKCEKLSKFKLNNKVEFLNENIAFKLLYDFCNNKNILDINPEKVEFNKINIFSILPLKQNVHKLNFNKICVDKISAINSILAIASKNTYLQEITIDKFISIPHIYRVDLIRIFSNLKDLNKFRINILSSSKEDLSFFNVPRLNPSIKKFYLKLSQLNIEDKDIMSSMQDGSNMNYFDLIHLKNTNLEKISLKFEKINLAETHTCFKFLKNIYPKNTINSLKELSLGMIDSLFFENFVKIAPGAISKLSKLKLSFLFTYIENYECSYKNILILIENCKNIKKFEFLNFILKYKHVCDEELKKVIEKNSYMRELTIQSDLPFLTQYLGGFYFYVFPKFLLLVFYLQ